MGVFQQPHLGSAGPLGDGGVVLQIGGDVSQQVVQGRARGVLAVGTDSPQPFQRLVVGPLDDRRFTKPGAQRGARSPT